MIRPTAIAMLAGALATLALGAFAGAAYAQTKLEGARVLSPTPLPQVIQTSQTSVDVSAFGRNLTSGLSTGGTVRVEGERINIGHYNTMNTTGALLIGVSSIPAGQYAVKVTFVNVGKAVSMNLVEGINKKSCAFEAKGGYLNEQSCTINIDSKGGGFNVKAAYTGDTFSEITLKNVEVGKTR